MRFSTTLATTAIALACGVSALPKVSRVGRYLYQEDGTRFYIKVRASQRLLALDPGADDMVGAV